MKHLHKHRNTIKYILVGGMMAWVLLFVMTQQVVEAFAAATPEQLQSSVNTGADAGYSLLFGVIAAVGGLFMGVGWVMIMVGGRTGAEMGKSWIVRVALGVGGFCLTGGIIGWIMTTFGTFSGVTV
ncbi:hypothetical protein [Listeria booriae]|uniref:Uncharacterized protein n=1 Tax=Listeria booriae TaxID=1552123 RepID=A0A7X0XM40_9LIST|nr:hypothetical protein [Listeria booriae]MBC1563599.1 hypothetical protein [Listeria booriae]